MTATAEHIWTGEHYFVYFYIKLMLLFLVVLSDGAQCQFLSQIPGGAPVCVSAREGWDGAGSCRSVSARGSCLSGQSGSRSNREDGSSHISHAGKDASNLNLTV